MKFRKLYILMTGIVGLMFISCHDLDLQPLSQASSETWFTDETQVEMSLNTLYLHQFWPMFKCDWGTTAIMSLDEASDDWINRTTLVPFTNGTLNGDNSTFLKNTWSHSFKAISRANTILENIYRSKENIKEAMTRYDERNRVYDPVALEYFGIKGDNTVPGRTWITASKTDHIFTVIPSKGVQKIQIKVESRFKTYMREVDLSL